MLSDKLAVSQDQVASGNGLIAGQAIHAGEVLWQPETKLPFLTNEQRKQLKDRRGYSQIDLDLFVRCYDNEWFFNHSCAPNCIIKDHLLIAVRDIPEGEEVTYDYGLTEITISWSFWCSCAKDGCRKHVSNLDYLNASLRTRMASYCP
ncbi:MAG: SET domain-containing protein-lysine N-methyltransferase [Coraliomargarita sp.]